MEKKTKKPTAINGISQVYCWNDYYFDYPRKERCKIDKVDILTEDDKARIRRGEIISKPDRGGTYTQRFLPYKEDPVSMNKKWR